MAARDVATSGSERSFCHASSYPPRTSSSSWDSRPARWNRGRPSSSAISCSAAARNTRARTAGGSPSACITGWRGSCPWWNGRTELRAVAAMTATCSRTCSTFFSYSRASTLSSRSAPRRKRRFSGDAPASHHACRNSRDHSELRTRKTPVLRHEGPQVTSLRLRILRSRHMIKSALVSLRRAEMSKSKLENIASESIHVIALKCELRSLSRAERTVLTLAQCADRSDPG
mmetsp:Transcript_67889/g.181539  ORF Transcript_67889/g.181539 Transcript_67889/m.181539 type:complete len:230 (+) Transcript_67889:74-763(+)